MGCGVFKVIKSSKRRSNLGGGGILGKLRTKVPNPILGELGRDILDYQEYPKLGFLIFSSYWDKFCITNSLSYMCGN